MSTQTPTPLSGPDRASWTGAGGQRGVKRAPQLPPGPAVPATSCVCTPRWGTSQNQAPAKGSGPAPPQPVREHCRALRACGFPLYQPQLLHQLGRPRGRGPGHAARDTAAVSRRPPRSAEEPPVLDTRARVSGYLVPQFLQPGVLQAVLLGAIVEGVAADCPGILPPVQTVLGQDDWERAGSVRAGPVLPCQRLAPPALGGASLPPVLRGFTSCLGLHHLCLGTHSTWEPRPLEVLGTSREKRAFPVFVCEREGFLEADSCPVPPPSQRGSPWRQDPGWGRSHSAYTQALLTLCRRDPDHHGTRDLGNQRRLLPRA